MFIIYSNPLLQFYIIRQKSYVDSIVIFINNIGELTGEMVGELTGEMDGELPGELRLNLGEGEGETGSYVQTTTPPSKLPSF